MLEELERFARRARAVPLAAPVLLLGGLGLGKVTTHILELPDSPVVAEASRPRIQLEPLGRYMEGLRREGQETEEYLILYRDHVEPVERVLRRRGVPAATARKVAWPLVEYAYRHRLDVPTVISVLLLESNGRPNATSPVGARGLMQVMPAWAGRWRECDRDLYDIEANICHGTRILAWYLRRAGGDQRRALLGYNGCVRGTNTPNCFSYPDRVIRLSHQIRNEISASRRPVPAAAAP